MRVAHYLPAVRLEDGGVVRFVLDLCAGLARAGHDVTLLCHDARDVPPAWDGRAGQPRIVSLPPRGPARLLGPRTLAKALSAIEHATALHAHEMWHVGGLQLLRGAARRGARTVLSPHGMLSTWSMAQRGWKKRAFLAVFDRWLRGLDRLLCTSEQERRDVIELLPWARASALLPLMDLTPYHDLPGPQQARQRWDLPSEPLVVFLSRIHAKKGPELLVEAIAELSRRRRHVHAVLAGRGTPEDEAALRTRIARLGLESQVRLVGPVAGRDKHSLLQAASLLALPTSHENFGFVVPETLACGTPVLTTRGLDLGSQFAATGAVRTVDRTPSAFAAEIAAMLDLGQAELRAAGERGRSWVLENFAAPHRLPAYEELYARG